MSALGILLNASSLPLAAPIGEEPVRSPGGRGRELADMLRAKNGFFAFEGALHVFPVGSGRRNIELARFNEASGWKARYWHVCDGLLFFAANVFGDLYGLRDDEVVRFDPETGLASALAPDLEGWAAWVVERRWTEVGWTVARDWQDRNGPLEEGRRLMPVRLFCMGGTADLDNLRAVPLEEGLSLRGEIASQIKDLPDGSAVRIQIVD